MSFEFRLKLDLPGIPGFLDHFYANVAQRVTWPAETEMDDNIAGTSFKYDSLNQYGENLNKVVKHQLILMVLGLGYNCWCDDCKPPGFWLRFG